MIMAYTMIDANGKTRCLGDFSSFGAARRAQHDSLPEDLKEAYAGISEGHPIFYLEFLTPELKTKYSQLADDPDK